MCQEFAGNFAELLPQNWIAAVLRTVVLQKLYLKSCLLVITILILEVE